MGERKMDPLEAIPWLEALWDISEGYFYKLRQGLYEPGGAERVEGLLRSVAVTEECDLPRRFVSLVWMIPIFMGWQIERVQENGGDTELLRKDIVRLENVLHEVLGVP